MKQLNNHIRHKNMCVYIFIHMDIYTKIYVFVYVRISMYISAIWYIITKGKVCSE